MKNSRKLRAIAELPHNWLTKRTDKIPNKNALSDVCGLNVQTPAIRKGNTLKGSSTNTEPQRSVQAHHPPVAVEFPCRSCRS